VVVPMVGVGEMGMRVGQGFVPMRVRMTRTGANRFVVLVVVMRIARAVGMPMDVLHRVVLVPMAVMLGQVQDHAERHQPTRQQQCRRDRIAQQ
jgi:hypothetical protein